MKRKKRTCRQPSIIAPLTDIPTPAPSDAARWHALKVFHNKVFSLEAELSALPEVECYVPRERVMVETPSGGRVRRVRPAVAGLLLLRCRPSALADIKTRIRQGAMFYPAADGTPAVIPTREMMMFRLVTSAADAPLEYLGDDPSVYAVGERVRVTSGVLQGAEGYIKRIRGNRRLVVSISGICAVATSYIPSCFLEKIDISGN